MAEARENRWKGRMYKYTQPLHYQKKHLYMVLQIGENEWKSMKINDNQWKYMKNQWKSMQNQ